MEHPPVDSSSSHDARARPLWVRGVILAAIWTLVLQPAVSLAQLSQTPLFTVTAAPPNVMLMFDDSASMNRLDLKPSSAFIPHYTSGGGPDYPALPLMNTTGYASISGVGYYCGGAPHAYCDGRWQFSQEEVLMRSAAFNPLAYNPAIQYKPWNDNGIRFPHASIGGTGPLTSGPRTEWDPRRLPPSMAPGYPSVASFLPAPNQGVIHRNNEARPITSPTPGSVVYGGLPDGKPNPYGTIVPGGTASGEDLFTSNIAFDSPDCTPDPTTYNYFWYCPAGAGGGYQPPGDVCDAVSHGNPSASGTCCNQVPNGPPIPNPGQLTWYDTFSPDGINPPPMAPPAPPASDTGVCESIVNVGNNPYTGPPCAPDVDPPPVPRPCGPQDPPGAENCFDDPPLIPGACTSYDNYRWRCYYRYTTYSQPMMCPMGGETPQYCGRNANPPTCSGAGGTPTLTGNARYVSGNWAAARYLVYDGPPSRTSAEIREMDNYRMIIVDRSFGWNTVTSSRDLIDNLSKYKVVDAVTGQAAPVGSRPDCTFPNAQPHPTLPTQDGSWCTFEQEAQNYANWFTYYRSRLFAAVGVTSEVASELVGPEQFMRMGYGRINYFGNGRNPWNVLSLADRLPATLPNIDGQGNPGGVERGVRPFTVYDPPLSLIPNPDRKQVFDWLFAINGLGPTPNREAMDGAGQYFSRTDSRGPWGQIPGAGAGEPASAHLWCRRNYALLATDGEWTRLPVGQPLLPPASPGTVSNSIAVTGPAITGTDRDNPLVTLNYQYFPDSELQITGAPGSSESETLTDVLHYYWSRDLRPPGPTDLRNSLKHDPAVARKRAFWQHMSSYIVGYGVQASFDTPSVRPTFDARNAIPWPAVGQEPCRQVDDNAEDNRLSGGTCVLTAPEGNRINDTLRAGLASGGEFFAATDPTSLKAQLKAVFAAIGSDPAAGTSPGLSSSTVGAGNLIIQSGFNTNVWDGFVRAYDQQALLTYLTSGGPAPTPLWTANFDPPASRPIYTTTDMSTAVEFRWGPGFISASQQSELGSSLVLDYLRGDQSRELSFPGGIFRSRNAPTLGDIVSSTPLYSAGADHGYARRPAASVVLPATATQGNTIYGQYVKDKRTLTLRTPVAIFGANDGMLHILDASTTSATRGKEIFAFVPRSLYSTLDELPNPAYAHRYYVDGPVIEGDIFNGTQWRTIAIGTTGAGTAGIFAIDITAPQSGFNASNVLWDIVPSEHPGSGLQPGVVASDLGNVLQPGILGSVKDNSAPNGAGRWVYITGNGYESASHQATLFVFDAFNGSLIKAIQTFEGSAAARNGLGGVTPVFDGNRNIIAVYGGDKLGNMWKFDLSSPCVNVVGPGCTKTWEIFNKVAGVPKPLFIATDDTDITRQPITAAPRITPHGLSGLHVAFGTGKLFEPGDQIDTRMQSVYVVWDKGQLPTIPKTSLARLRLDDTLTAAGDREFNPTDLAGYDWTQEGFYVPFNLAPAGERVLSAGFLDAGVLSFTTFAQQDSSVVDLCTPGGTSFVYRFNLAGGLNQAGFLGVTRPVVGRRVQPGLVSGAPPIYEPIAPPGGTIHEMDAAAATAMMKSPQYEQKGGRARRPAGAAVGNCAHIGLKVDGSMARIETACAGLMPLRTWRNVR